MQNDLRIGKIIGVQELSNIEYTTHKLSIDFGDQMGIKTSLASLRRYKTEKLLNKFVICIVNVPPKQIGKYLSEVVILGTPDKNKECILISPESSDVIIGEKVY